MGEAPRPKSPPRYPDLCGRRRLQLEVQILNREVGFLEQELQGLERIQPVSRCCKDVNEFVGAKTDPLIPINKRRHRSCSLCRWIRSKWCTCLSCLCCWCRCLPKPKMPSCFSCSCCSCCDTSCCRPSCSCLNCRSSCYKGQQPSSCCKCQSSCCEGEPSCCCGGGRSSCLSVPAPSCPECSCGCVCSCPRARTLRRTSTAARATRRGRVAAAAERTAVEGRAATAERSALEGSGGEGGEERRGGVGRRWRT
ncbi:hypothetical protein ABZP36_024528 [Zizania latifolia]